MKVSSTVVALYKYLGDGTVVNTAYPEADVYKPVNTATTGVYRMDNFGRITDDRWVKNLAPPSSDQQFVELDIAYDRNSNIVGVTDNIHKSVGGNRNFDAKYSIDDLNRLLRAEEGTLTAGTISNRSRDEQWTLSQTGNWGVSKLDLDWSDAGEFQGTRTHNIVNELTKRELDTNATVGFEETFKLGYDSLGNLTDDGEHYEYVYDPFARLRFVKRTDNQAVVAEYRYNGLGFRVGSQTDVTNDGTTGDHDGVVPLSLHPWKGSSN